MALHTRTAPLPPRLEKIWRDKMFDAAAGPNLIFGLDVDVEVTPEMFKRCVEQLARRHEALRSFMSAEGSPPRQVVAAPGPCRIAVVELPDDSEEARAALRAFKDEPFDLYAGPPVRYGYCTRRDGRTSLLICVQHYFCDGASANLLMAELYALLRLARRGAHLDLPPTVQGMSDFGEHQSRLLENGLSDLEKRWTPLLVDAPDCPVDQLSDETIGVEHTMSPVLVRGLHAVAQASGATLAEVLLTAHAYALATIHDAPRPVIGVTVTARSGRLFNDTVGFLLNAVAFRAETKLVADLRQRVADTAVALREAYRTPAISLETAEHMIVPGRLAAHSLFNFIPSSGVTPAAADVTAKIRPFDPHDLFPTTGQRVAVRRSLVMRIIPTANSYRIVLDGNAATSELRGLNAHLDAMVAHLRQAVRAS